ncbi:MAG: hypothetical protein OXC72_12325 [Roseovarius sp.]|nr:hypothetical protein [Roseovarius sp.]MCY4315007.1 hypothetical protein [Roseovarius sp.]
MDLTPGRAPFFCHFIESYVYYMTLKLALLIFAALLSIKVAMEDVRNLEVSASATFLLALTATAIGFLFPAPGMHPHHAIVGCAMGLMTGLAARWFVKCRHRAAAFGGADVILIAGAGGLLGPFMFGCWLFSAALTGIAFSRMVPVFSKRIRVDGKSMIVIPFCPSIISSAAVFFLALNANAL